MRYGDLHCRILHDRRAYGVMRSLGCCFWAADVYVEISRTCSTTKTWLKVITWGTHKVASHFNTVDIAWAKMTQEYTMHLRV